MPSEFPGSPRLIKGALVVYEDHTAGSESKVIPFQYNPEQVGRSVSHTRAQSTSGTSASRGEAHRDLDHLERLLRTSVGARRRLVERHGAG